MLIYLASPYSYKSDNQEHRRMMEAARYHKVCDITGKLMKRGIPVFSSIVHCHPLAVMHDLPKTFEFWQEYDERMISACDEVWVARMPDWEKSKGIASEIQYAKEKGIPVKYLDFPNFDTPVEA